MSGTRAEHRSATAPVSSISSASSGFRPELHGLRGLAIALVVGYHVWFDRVSGGVDVFLFISAFLLTGTFVRRMDRGLPLHPIAYWARAFKRLLPPAMVVILATLLATRLLLPPSTWIPVMGDAIASLLQVENWLLIHRDADYEAATGIGTSPLQHFWSLSIQGQVFLLWPLLLTACALLARGLRRPVRGVIAVVFGLIAMVSLAWSVHSTGTQQPVAYFDTTTRIWEFAAGSLLALVPAAAPADGRRVRRSAVPLRVLLGWLGLAVLVTTGAVIDGQARFPGWIAAVPLLGACLVFLAGTSRSRLGADRLLSSRPLSFLGDISYGLYLVHWPILIIVLLVTGREQAGALDGAAIIAVSVLAAYGLTRVIDTPVRRWRWANTTPLRSAVVAAVVLMLGIAPAVVGRTVLENGSAQATLRTEIDHPGGRVLDPDITVHPDADPAAPPLPAPATLRQDWARLPQPCTSDLAPAAPAIEGCSMSDAPEDAKVMVAVGNSRLAQSAMALSEPAARHGWRLVLIRRPSCAFTPGVPSYTGEECDAHNDAVLELLRELEPDAVAMATTLLPHEGPERVSPVLEETVPLLLDEGIPVIAVRDVPRLPEDPVTCLEQGGSEEDCTWELDPGIMPAGRADAGDLAALAGRDGLHPLDLLPVTCPEGSCPPVIGNVHVFFDPDHITATYLRSLGGEVERQLSASGLEW